MLKNYQDVLPLAGLAFALAVTVAWVGLTGLRIV